MANKTINDYSAATNIDATADYLLIDPSGSGNYKKINRNVFTGLTSAPVSINDVQTLTNKTFDNTNVFTSKDSNFTLQDNSDTAKQAKFELSGITTANTRTVTLPDSNTTLPIASQVVTVAGPTNARTYTFPDANTTVAGIATAQTLTNKTITDSTNVLGGVTMTLGSDATGDMYYRTGGVLTRLPIGTAGQVLTTNGGATAPAWGSSASQMTLLKANSNSDTSAGATNLDTYAISGLTAKDTIKIFYNFSCVAQNTAASMIYQATSGTKLCPVANNAVITAGNTVMGEATLRQDPQTNTTYHAFAADVQSSLGTLNGPISPGSIYGSTQSLTAWTGSWTIALRSGGVTAGGTLYWSWAVYKIAGQ